MIDNQIVGGETVMVWAGIIDQHVIGPYFFEGNVNSAAYLDMLNNYALPRLQELGFDFNQVYYQHDGSPVHFQIDVRNLLDENFPTWIGRGGEINWPARSPDLTILDFFLWGFIKDKVYDTRPQDMEDLRRKIREAFEMVTPDMLIRGHENTMFRLHYCRNAEGFHFEHLM